MTEEEKKAKDKADIEAAEAAKAAETAKALEESQKDAKLIAEKETEIQKLKEERDNYKKVALKRLGKLENDADFLAGKDSDLTVEDQIKLALLDKEIDLAGQQRETELKRVLKENTELRLALKNRPGDSIGSGSGSGDSTTVKDPIFSEAQLVVLREKAKRLGAEPERFIENAKKNMLNRG